MYCVMCVLGHSAGSDPATSRTIAHQAPLSMGLSRQEYWSGLLFPSLGDLTSIIPSAKSDSFISCHPIRVGIFGTALCASIDLVCLWKKVSSGSLYTAILWLEFHFLLKWSFLKSHHFIIFINSNVIKIFSTFKKYLL